MAKETETETATDPIAVIYRIDVDIVNHFAL
jgi:hypothetical protein